MIKYTPIKRHRALASLSRDHHFGLLFVWKIRQGIDKGIRAERISNYVLYFFKEDLSNHFKVEEQSLFRQLPVDDTLRKRAEADHAIIYDLVIAIEKNKKDLELLSRLASELERHIRFEERELFNHIQEISAHKLIEIPGQNTDHGQGTDERWNDQFWK